ncbi:hypothetical protein DSC45_08555 [Streptomyces sp. YIM 130001]|nr:hypothetical protein DSC45_08555 [Streptomyces sp. YIM 130001]
MAAVTELITYPVKGCAGFSSERTHLTPAGLAHDRSFMVVGPGGVYRSQRRDPRLALIRPEPSPDGTRLTLNAPGIEPLTIGVDIESPRCDVELFDNWYRGIDQGKDAADWLSETLRAESRLVRVPPEHDRQTDGLTPGTCGWADSGAVNLISRAALDALNTRIVRGGRTPLPMSRFRPNIVVDGWEAHREDSVRRIDLGGSTLAFAKHVVRCAVTLVDQESGAKAGPEPLRTLAAYRRAPSGGVIFSANYSVLRPGRISVGDEPVVTAGELAAEPPTTTPRFPEVSERPSPSAGP